MGETAPRRQCRPRRHRAQRARRRRARIPCVPRCSRSSAGADGITAHLREDRRHIRDDDMARLKAAINKPLNFEMAATEQMLDIALRTKPHACCLVPEKRTERTTEGGLDVVGQHDYLKPFVAELGRAGESAFRCSSSRRAASLQAAASLKAPVVELHTGAWCDAVAQGERRQGRRTNSRGFARRPSL